MFSSVKNYVKNLQYSQRFENNNFAYYNDYESKGDDDYDLTKMFYNCSRKTQPLITLVSETVDEPYRAIEITDSPFTNIDRMLHNFYTIYNENNYSDVKDDFEQFKYKHAIKYYPDEFEFMTSSVDKRKIFVEKCRNSLSIMQTFLEDMKNISQKMLEAGDQLDPDPDKVDMTLYQTLFEFQGLMIKNIDELLSQCQTDKPQSLFMKTNIFNFKMIVEDLLDQMTSAELWPVLLLTIPYAPEIQGMINPMTMALHGFMERERRAMEMLTKEHPDEDLGQEPRIVFINLDGNESHLNIRAVNNIPQSVYYISIFKEPEPQRLQEYERPINQANSHLLISQYCELLKKTDFAKVYGILPESKKGQRSKMLLFPLNSEYLKSEYKKRHNKEIPEFGSSQDILFLFEQVIYNEVRDYLPNTIIISYNGQLDIYEDHFNEIIRNLTIIGDHRLMLFPNMSGMLNYKDKDKMVVDLTDAQNYKLKYSLYDMYFINVERLFNNLAMFVKLTSGAYSLEDRNVLPDHCRYSNGRRYEYLEKVFDMEYFEEYRKFANRFWSCDELNQMLNKQKKILLDINANENEGYSKLIDQVTEILCDEQRCIGYFQDNEDSKMTQRIQSLFQRTEGNPRPYLENKKADLLIENIFELKVSKIYRQFPGSHKLMDRIHSFKFKLKDSEDNDQLKFQKYTQIVMNQQTHSVFILNHHTNGYKHVNLYGIVSGTDANGNIIEVVEIKHPQPQDHVVYINYSTCFMGDSLFLIWPTKFNMEEAVACKLLGLEYRPKIVNKVFRLAWQGSFEEDRYNKFTFSQVKLDVKDSRPRYGCSCFGQEDKNRIFIFGGIFSDYNDFFYLPPGVSVLEWKASGNSILKTDPRFPQGDRLKPKMFYSIKLPIKKNQRDTKINSIVIHGGFGRDFTNMFSLFSCTFYEFSLERNEIKRSRHPMKVIKLPEPIYIKKMGIFSMVSERNNKLEAPVEKYSHLPKDKFIFDDSKELQDSQGDIISFADEQCRVSEFKTEHKKMYLFGIGRKLKQSIYLEYWSPELYLHDGIAIKRIEIKISPVTKTKDKKVAKQILPSEQTIISTALDDNKISMLIMDMFNAQQYLIYEGDLSNLNDIFATRRLAMSHKFTFAPIECKTKENQRSHYDFLNKSLFLDDDTILIVGGAPTHSNKRHDIVLQKKRHKYTYKFRAVSVTYKQQIMELNVPYIIKEDGHLFYYALIKLDKWYIKFEQTTLNFQKSSMKMFPLHISTAHNKTSKNIKFVLNKPYFVKIMKYDMYNSNYLSDELKKMVAILNSEEKGIKAKSEQEGNIKDEDKQLLALLANLREFFKNPSLTEPLQLVEKINNKVKAFMESAKKQQLKLDDSITRQLFSIVNYCRKIQIQQCSLRKCRKPEKDQEDSVYRFVFEDAQGSKKIKYFAIGHLGSTELQFVRVQFNSENVICLNHKNDDSLFLSLTKEDILDMKPKREPQSVEIKENNEVRSYELKSEFVHDLLKVD